MSLALCRASCARRPMAIPVPASRAHAMPLQLPLAAPAHTPALLSPSSPGHLPGASAIVCSAARSGPRGATGHLVSSLRTPFPLPHSPQALPSSDIARAAARPLASAANSPGPTAEEASDPAKASPATPPAEGSGNGAASSESAGAEQPKELPLGDPEFTPLQGWGKLGAQFKMFFAPPWARVKKGSVLTLKLSGRVSEQLMGLGSSTLALPKLLENLEKAAVDPRVAALAVRIDTLSIGWGKVDEIRRYINLFKKSGKPTVAYMQVVGEFEYYLASAFDEIYIPPSAYISLRGLAVQGAFLGGVLEKAGIEPQVQRIGKYKSAGDQLLRKDISDANREMLTAILDDTYFNWISAIAAAKGKSVDELQALLDGGLIQGEQLLEHGLVTGLKYESEVEALLKEKVGQTDKDKPLVKVEYRKYSRVSKSTLNLGGGKDAMIAVLRASGAISQGRDRGMGGSVKSDSFIDKIRFVRESKQFKAVVLRVDSPGGDALASDLMWHELRELAKAKPLVASMSDVAASGGYYMAMAAPTIVAEHLTLTGSIGVVLAKFNLGNLYGRIGFNREVISKGKYAELFSDNRSFSPEEEKFFAEGAQSAYESFRNKAAFSRSMEVEAMEAVAQGRVWTGNQARQRGLVDALGGISRAVAIAKERAGIPADKKVRTVELSVAGPTLTALLSGARVISQLLGMEGGAAQRAVLGSILFGNLEGALGQDTSLLLSSPPGSCQAVSPEVQVVGLSQASQHGLLSPSSASSLFGDSNTSAASSLPLLQGLLLPSLLQDNSKPN